MNPAKKLMKNDQRKERNRQAKVKKAETRKALAVMLGKTVVEKEVPTGNIVDGKPETKKVLEFPAYIKTSADGTPLPFRGQQQNPPRLGWLGAKGFKQRLGGRKNRPGEKDAHALAIIEDAGRTFAKEVDKALAPPAEETVPVVPINAAEQVAAL